MIKVFLVEDEFIVREGIKNNIDWDKYGYEFCGEASDGELAFPMISKEKPDIVITDIRMPFMDGLELSRLIKKEFPQIKIIILSGHEEFEYAKTAIQIGIEEYLLKPINGDELLQAVNHVAEKIKEERENSLIGNHDLNDVLELKVNAKRELFNDLIAGETALSEMLERGKGLELDLMAECYNILMLKIQRPQNGESYSKRIEEIYERIEAYAEEQREDMICFDRAPEGKSILFKGEDEGDVDRKIESFTEFFVKLIAGYEDVSYFGGVGQSVMRLREFNRSYEAASHAFAYRFLVDGNRILCMQDIEKKDQLNAAGSNCLVGSVDTGNLDKRKIEGFLRGGEIDEIRFFVTEYIRNTGEAGNSSMIFRQYIIMDMFFAATHFLGQLDAEYAKELQEPFSSPEQMQDTISRLDTTIDYIVSLFQRVMEVRDRQVTEHNSDVVEMAKRYIQDTFSDEDITLNSVASFVNVSPNHMSAMFSQKTGQTFVKYLTDVRMNRAKELLKCTNMRSNEISEEVGYKDPHYFSHLFKKNVGCTPLQYRERSGCE